MKLTDKVLYVEDERLTMKITTTILSKYFENIYTAENGKEGLDLFNSEVPALLITDLAMPVMSGFELIDEVQSKQPDFPIIVTTAYREETESLNNIVILGKPVNRDMLVEAISKALGIDLHEFRS